MMENKISLITASRRPEKFRNLVSQLEDSLGSLMTEYIVLNNSNSLKEDFLKTQKENSKIKVINTPENYLYKMGFDSAYNLLSKTAKSDYSLILFDVDEVKIDKNKMLENFSIGADVYFFPMLMERGNAKEKKFQLYKNDNLLKWYGLVHENQTYQRNPNILELEGFEVIHRNAVDDASKNIKLSPDGFIILEDTDEGTDSDSRNMLYESLAWKIVNAGGRHMNPAWFKRHYEINKKLIDQYYERAKEKWEN